MKAIIFCTVLACGGSLAFAGNDKLIEAARAKAVGLVGERAPDFSLQDLHGRTFGLAERRGKVVVLAFWATWCPPCRAEMPMFASLQKEFGSSSVVIVPIAVDEAGSARSFLEKRKIVVWTLIDERGKEGRRVALLYGANALPKTFVVDRDGVVVKAFIGKTSEADVRAAIQAAQR